MDTRGYGRTGGATRGRAPDDRRADAGRAVRHLRRRLRRPRPHRAPAAGRCRCWPLGVVARGRRAGQRRSAGRSAPATARTAGGWPELGRRRVGRGRRRRRLVARPGTSSLVAYPPLDAVPQVSLLALLGVAVGLARWPLLAAGGRPVHAPRRARARWRRMIELRDIRFAYDDDARCSTRRRPRPSTRASWCWSPGRPASASRRCSACSPGWCRGSAAARCAATCCSTAPASSRTPPRERAHAIGYVGQDPAAGFVTDTVEEELAYGMEQLGLPPATMRRRVEETLDLLGIADLRARDLRTLSGGAAAAGRDRLGAHHAPAAAGARRADLGPRPDRRRGGAGHADPAGARPRASRCCSPSTGSSGWCRSPTGWPCSPATGACASASPPTLLGHLARRAADRRARAGPPAGRRCR